MAASVTNPSAHSSCQPRYDPQFELRLAVVMYGGVSLAIYMYGVADELHRLVLSTAPDANDRETLRAPTSTEAVYREVARLLDPGHRDQASEPLAARFVVDIIAGTSAGGINGICLAKALVNDASLDGLKKIWLHEADISRLIADERSAMDEDEDEELFKYVFPPASLLSGPRMQRRLVEALAGMKREDPEAESPLVDELDLWVTSTDLEGLPVTMRLANGTAYESRHANRFQFRYSRREERDDFRPETNDFLAYAARSTSAFPFAFDPARLEAFRPEGMDDDAWEAAKKAWLGFHPDYPDSAKPPFAERFFSDGGILDNKPFSSATGTLVGRRADLPVKRKLVYVEPDPAAAPDRQRKVHDAWNFIDTAQAATLRIPQVETIREDLQVVQQRNRDIERVRDIVNRLGLGPERQRLQDAARSAKSEAWGQKTFEQLVGDEQWGPAYGVYHQLKVRGVVDWLAGIIVRQQGFDPQSDQALAVHQLARAFKDTSYNDEPEGAPCGSAQFLLDFDLPYRLRRMDFVLQKLNQLTGDDPEDRERAAAVPELSAAVPPAAEVRRLKAELAGLRDELARLEITLGWAIGELGITREDLDSILNLRTDADMAARGRALVQQHTETFSLAAEMIRSGVATAGEEARSRIDALLGEIRTEGGPASDLRAALRFYFDAFEAYDLALYPLGFGTSLSETNPVDIVRISPRDADLLVPQAQRPPLKGAALHHFGAFLDQGWREHDIVWGRLDASECLIRSLLGISHPRCEELVRAAHRAILADYAKEKGAGDEEPIDWFLKLPFNAEPDRTATGEVLSRARQVIAVLLRAISEERGSGTGNVLPPVIDATLGAGPRGAAVGALLRTPVGLTVTGVVAVLVAAGLLLLLATGAPSYVGAALLGVGATLLVAGLAGLTFALTKLRDAIRTASLKAVYAPKRDAGAPPPPLA